MRDMKDTIHALSAHAGYWAERATAQLKYATKLSKVRDGRYDATIAEATNALAARAAREGAIDKDACREVEDLLADLSGVAKSQTIVCASHAHIDMNWMWSYPETTAVTLDTFRTMLQLMREYPDFVFSQSQASVYRIVEEYDPELLAEIRQRVQEGRWEVTASTWVEADKNMPVGESFARHALYTKGYLSRLLGIDPDALCIDFEPDTFGHSRNLPEILGSAGVRYYYHTRGLESPMPRAYRWRAPSGAEVLAYHDVQGYNAAIDSEFALLVPEFCAASGMNTMLKVYGVGDHGGGPTRRDLERILDMNTWPVFPKLRFGRYAEFFADMEAVAQGLPVIDREMNFVFSGCYTTQTRIKMANRYGEARLHDAEALSTFAANAAGRAYPGDLVRDAWEKVLFSQFHDIVTGSGVIDTREYAMGQFQRVLAATNSAQAGAMSALAGRIDTSIWREDPPDAAVDTSEGAGVGYGVTDHALPQAERGRGLLRVLHFFNPTAYRRRELAQAVIWDWPGEVSRAVVRDGNGEIVPHQVVGGKAQQLHPEGAYWGHQYSKLLVQVDVPPFGYATYALSEAPKEDFQPTLAVFPKVERPDGYVLENEHARIRFDTHTAQIVSWTDKDGGAELVDPHRPSGVFRFIEEDTDKGMTSWIVGRHMRVRNLHAEEFVKVTEYHAEPGAIRQWIAYTIAFERSRLTAKLSLDAGSPGLRVDVEWDWHELPVPGVVIPQLNFHVPFAHAAGAYRFDVPFGMATRAEADMDLPGNSFIAPVPNEHGGKALALLSDNKYGFRGVADSVAVTLVRSAYEPDPLPESGRGKTSLLVLPTAGGDDAALLEASRRFCHAIAYLSGTRHGGSMPLAGGFLSLEGKGVAVSAVKMPEDGAAGEAIVRLYEFEGNDAQAVLHFHAELADARVVDVNERACDGAVRVQGNRAIVDVGAHRVVGVRVRWR